MISKLNISFWSFIAFTILFLPGCMSVTGSSTVVAPTSTTQFNNKKIAILPAKMQASLAPDSVLALRIEVNKRLAPALRAKIPAAIVTDVADVTDRLNQTNSLTNFEQLLTSYEATGIMDKRQVTALGQALNCDFLLVSRLKSEKLDIGFISKGAGASLEVMLVNASTGEIGWAGSGEWKKGGMFGQGGAGFDELAENIVTPAFATLQSSGESTQPAAKVPERTEGNIPVQEAKPVKKTGSNQELARVQQKLIDLGYKPGAADGISGKKTINALTKFQQDNGLPVTGKADQETMDKLFQKSGPAKEAMSSPASQVGGATQDMQQTGTTPEPPAEPASPTLPSTDATAQDKEVPAVPSPTDL